MSDAEERIWWARVDAVRDRLGPGSEVMSDWSHDMIAVLGVGPHNNLELVPGRGWVEIPKERWTDQYKQAETKRLCDELGLALGIGAMPGGEP